jgi:hypothetical protein
MAASRSMNPVQKVILRHGPFFQKIGFEVVGDGWPVQKSGARVAFPPWTRRFAPATPDIGFAPDSGRSDAYG